MDSSDSSDFEGFPEDSLCVGTILETDSDIEISLSDISDVESGAEISDDDVDDDSSEVPDHFTGDLHGIDILNFCEYVGPIHHLDDSSSVLDFFHLLFEPNSYDTLVQQTIIYADQQQTETGIIDHYWTPPTVPEIKAFIAINILMGIHQLPDIDSYWSTDDRLEVDGISKIMPKRRFKKLSQYLHLSNNEEALPHDSPQYDALLKVRPLINMLSRTFRDRYKPNCEMSIDEAMVAYKGRHHMKQYLPAKPTKWGFKVWTLADSHNGYVCGFDIYKGRQQNPSVSGLGFDVVMNLMEPFQYLRHHFCFDNFFTSLHLIESLEKCRTYACGTYRANRKGIAQKLRNPGRLAQGDIIKRQKGNVVAVVWHDKRDVRVISSNSNPVDGQVNRKGSRRPGDQEQNIIHVPCPQSVISYNKYMGGVDLADQNRAYYSVGRESVKFWRSLLWYMINTAIINALVLYRESFRPHTRDRSRMTNIKFRLKLCEELVAGFSCRQRHPGKTKRSAVIALGNLPAHDLIHIDGRKRICLNCSEMDRSTKSNKKIQTSFECRMCRVALCQSGCLIEYHDRHLQIEN